MGLDKIMYNATICGKLHFHLYCMHVKLLYIYVAIGQGETREEGGSCPAVDCSFENNKLCQYKNGILSSGRASPGAVVKKWMLANRQVSNSLTGIFADRTGST